MQSFQLTTILLAYICNVESDYNHTEQYQLHFTSPIVANEKCVNITVYDDSMLEPPEAMRLTLHSTNGYVDFQAEANVTIVDNDCKLWSHDIVY